jgi:3-hydroxybutyryl-CoA dehydrogenase
MVEVMKAPHTVTQVMERAKQVAERKWRSPVMRERKRCNFLANRIVATIRTETHYLVAMGVVSFADLHATVIQGMGHPAGPFQLVDLTRTDLLHHVNINLFREMGDVSSRTSP